MTDTRTEARERVRRGQGLVEFALILPILLLVLIGILEFARILFIYVNVSNAAREGARYGVVHPMDLGGIENHVTPYLALVGDDVVPAVSYDAGPGTARFADGCAVATGDRVGVRIEYTIDAMTPIIRPFMPDGLDFNTESWRTIQYVRTGAISTPAGPAPPPSSDPTLPVAIQIDEPLSIGVSSVQGSGEAGESVQLTVNGDAIGTVVIGNDGIFSVSLPNPLNIHDVVTVTGQNGYESSDMVTVAGDELRLTEPLLADDLVVGGTGEPSAAVAWQLNRGEDTPYLGTVQIGADGRFSLSIPGGLNSGDVVLVSGYGSSDSATAVGQAIIIAEPLLAGAAVVSGTGQAGASIEIQLGGDGRSGTVTIGADGTFSYAVSGGLLIGEIVTVSGYGTSDQATVGGIALQIDEPLEAYDTVVTGIGQAGASFELLVNGVLIGPGSVDATGHFGFDVFLTYHDKVQVRGYGSVDEATVGGDPEPITITDVYSGDIAIAGTAQKGYAVTLFIPQTGLQRTVPVQADGTYTFSTLHKMVCGYTVVVSGYGQRASTTVCGAEVPPIPTGARIYIDDVCLGVGTHTVAVHAREFTATGSPEVHILLDEELIGSGVSVFTAGTLDVDVQIVIDALAPESHILKLQVMWTDGTSVMESASTVVHVCEQMPDLTIADLTVLDVPPLSSYQPLNALVTIRNGGERDVTSLFWVQLYGDYDQSTEPETWNFIEHYGFTGLTAQTSVSFTMVMRDGYATLGGHQIAAEIDAWEQIDESDETNNLFAGEIVNITIPGPTPEPTPQITPEAVGIVFGDVIGGPGATVFINCYPPVASVQTGGSGDYVLSDVPVGTWVVTAELFLNGEYYYGSRTVIVSDGTYSQADISLAAFSLAQ